MSQQFLVEHIKRTSGGVDASGKLRGDPMPDELVIYRGGTQDPATGHVHVVADDKGHVIAGFVVARVIHDEDGHRLVFCKPLSPSETKAVAECALAALAKA
jgi:hypothetical protein